MKIENNIIKHHLKNVYFIGGTACGGKQQSSTIDNTLQQVEQLFKFH